MRLYSSRQLTWSAEYELKLYIVILVYNLGLVLCAAHRNIFTCFTHILIGKKEHCQRSLVYVRLFVLNYPINTRNTRSKKST